MPRRGSETESHRNPSAQPGTAPTAGGEDAGKAPFTGGRPRGRTEVNDRRLGRSEKRRRVNQLMQEHQVHFTLCNFYIVQRYRFSLFYKLMRSDKILRQRANLCYLNSSTIVSAVWEIRYRLKGMGHETEFKYLSKNR
jgi:hypothetical protein